MKGLLYILLGMAIGFLAGFFRKESAHRNDDAVRDTVVYVDTARIVPSVRDSVVVRYIEERLPVSVPNADSCCTEDRVSDSADVVLPVTQKIYSNDLYRAYVSGYRPSLDSLILYTPTVEIRTKEKSRRWSVGPYVGVDITGRPSFGISLSYSVFRF